MSFNYQARRVRDPGHPVWLRLSSLRACVRSYCRLTGESFDAMAASLGLRFSRDVPGDPPTDEFLRRTLDRVERERNRYLDRLRTFEKKRFRAKSRGSRQLSAGERAALGQMRGGG